MSNKTSYKSQILTKSLSQCLVMLIHF